MAIDIIIPGFEMHAEIGEGGMARVFRATQTSLGREVAIKVLRRTLAGGGDFQRRFLHEGQLLAKLNHPNIVPIHDIGQTEEEYYMAMEYLTGGELGDRMKAGMSVAEVVRVCTQMAHALELAHQHKIVHRDLKPSNIMFRDEITPVLTDFGIAKKTDAEHSLTKTGMVVGTPYYMSPEQITGKPVDGRSDLYSLGIMFFELLTGALPFKAEEPLALAMQHVQEEPPPLPEDLAELQPIFDKMLAKSSEDRYPTMLAFCSAVKDLVMSDSKFAQQLSGETKLFNSDQFSDPRFGSGGLKVPERVTRDIKRGGSTSVSALGGIGWKIPAAITLGLAIVGFGVWYQMTDTGLGELSEKDQRIVTNLLNRVDGYVSTNAIDEPPGENAVDALKRVLVIAPNLPAAVEAGERIALYYEIDAQLALDAGNLEAAADEINRGLAVAPNYQPLTDLKAQIDVQLAGIQRTAKITELLAAASGHVEAKRLIDGEGGNAYEAFQEVLKLDPVNETASTGLNTIQQTLVDVARAAIEDSKFDVARAQIDSADELFPRSALITQTRQLLFNQQRSAQEDLEVSALLAQAEQQMKNEQFVEPLDQNALETFKRVLNLRSESQPAMAGLNRIAQHFERLAKRAVEQGDTLAAVDFATSGLNAVPDYPSLIDIQNQATNDLDAVSREIQQALQQAERFALTGRFLTEGGSTLASFQKVLELDANNQRAKDGIAELPNRIYSFAEQLQRAENYRTARDLLALSIKQFPKESRFASMDKNIADQFDAQMRLNRLNSLLADSRRLIEARPISIASINRASKAIKDILKDYPNDVNAVSQLGQFTTAIGEEADQLSASGNDEASVSLVAAGLREFPGNRGLVNVRGNIEGRQEQRRQDELARVAAISGQLSIDAMPWGEVIEIRNADGTMTRLPNEPTTPMVISLVEGSYSVTVRGDDGSNQKVDVAVQRQQTVARRVEFRTMTTDRYFERSGW